MAFQIEKKQTNADKIRQMSDEELAEWLENIDTAFEEGTVVMAHGWLYWLKQEVQADGGPLAFLDEISEKMDNIVEVVRCKDCRWWKTNYTWNGKEARVCVIEPYEPCRKPDDYCSRGERKGGDE